jgi:hypothetical protein
VLVGVEVGAHEQRVGCAERQRERQHPPVRPQHRPRLNPPRLLRRRGRTGVARRRAGSARSSPVAHHQGPGRPTRPEVRGGATTRAAALGPCGRAPVPHSGAGVSRGRDERGRAAEELRLKTAAALLLFGWRSGIGASWAWRLS